MKSHHHRNDALQNSKIDLFWIWFQDSSAELGQNLENKLLLNELDKRVLALGDVAWEVGPGRVEPNALVITPDGSREQIKTTQRIISRAPKISGWEFHWARPLKEWNLQFSILRDGGGQLNIDARPWKYVLFGYPDRTFDILLEQNNLLEISDNERYMTAVILLDGILGEFKRLELICGIKAVSKLPEIHLANANLIEMLAKHVDHLKLGTAQ